MKETTACSRELGHELRQRRERAGLSSVDMAGRLGWSHSKISRMETGIRGAAETDVVHYLAHLGYGSVEMRALRALCRESARDLGYWLGAPGSLTFHEADANVSISYHPERIPVPLITGDDTVHLPKPHRTYLLHERTLADRPPDGPVSLEQVLKLLLLADLPYITIMVVPTGEIFGGEFRLLEFGSHSPLVHVEGHHIGLFLEEHASVTGYRALIARIMDAALDAEQTRDLLVGLAGRAPAAPRSVPPEPGGM
jgi:transcriptional regulator with XRE-family HTH domain